MDQKRVLLIGNSHGWTYKYVKKTGFDFADAYKNHGLIFRVIREVFFRLHLPGKSFFYNKNIKGEYDVFFVGEALITYEYLKWLHEKYPQVTIILFYSNKVNPNYSPDGFSDRWCVKWTSDKDDAIKYGMYLWEGGGYYRQWKVTKSTPLYDVFYVGKDKGRLQRLRRIEKLFNDNGVNTMFYITWERGWQKKDDGIHKPFLSYEGVLDYIGKSRAILHLLDGAQNGVTLRIQESLIHKVKLITDDENITDYDFYNPNNIFILGKDNIDRLREFLDSPYEDVESDFYNHMFYDQMIKEVVGRSLEIKEQ